MNYRKNNISIEAILVMLLLVIFSISIAILIIQGSASYDRIIQNKEQQENARIAFSYVEMRIRQNDVKGKIEYQADIMSQSGLDHVVPGIKIIHSGEELGYVTYVYFEAGKLWECYTDDDAAPTLELSYEIAQVEDMTFSMNEQKDSLLTTVTYLENSKAITLSSYVHIKSKNL